MNENLMKSYYLKESLREIWQQDTLEEAELVLYDWLKQAEQAKIRQITKCATR